MSFRLAIPFLPKPLTGVRLAEAPASAADSSRAEQHAKAEAEIAAAYRRGWEEGQKELNDQIITQRQELVGLQKGVFESLRAAMPQVLRDSEQALVSLTLELARKLVSGLPISAEMVEAAVKEAVSHVEDATEFHIYLHGEDLDLLKKVDSDLLDASTHPPHFNFHSTPDIARGGCLVKTQFGILDASRDKKAALLQEAILT